MPGEKVAIGYAACVDTDTKLVHQCKRGVSSSHEDPPVRIASNGSIANDPSFGTLTFSRDPISVVRRPAASRSACWRPSTSILVRQRLSDKLPVLRGMAPNASSVPMASDLFGPRTRVDIPGAGRANAAWLWIFQTCRHGGAV